MMKIGKKVIGQGDVFVIAEIGINHNGSLDVALQLIDAAIEAGCDAVKFQKRTVEVVYTAEELAKSREVDESIIRNAIHRSCIEGVDYHVLSDEALKRLNADIKNTTNGDLKYALEFDLKEFDIIDNYCKEKGIYWFASCWDGLSAHFMNGFNVVCHKIASACLTNEDLLRRVRYNGKPIILSTGGSTLEQIKKAVDILGREDLVILHCVADYPAKDEDINLLMIDTLKQIFPGVPVGYSGHEADNLASVLAVARGACMIEKHITLDKKMPGSDHKASINPDEFKRLVSDIRRVQSMLGDGVKKVLPAEQAVMEKLRRVKSF